LLRTGRPVARGGASDRWQTADFEQLEPERLDLREHAIQRGAVGERPGQHGVAAAGLSLQGRERGADRLAQAAADTDAVPVRRPISVGTGHGLTTHVNRSAGGRMVTGTCTGDPSCLSRSSPRAAALAGERPAHDRGDLRHDQRLWLEDMTGPRARRVTSRGCAPAQARRAGPLPCRSRSASRPRESDCFSGLRRTRLPFPLAAGCEPRAGLREMPSRNLRDDLPHPRAGRRHPHRCPDRKRQPPALTPSTRRCGHPGRRLTHQRPGNKGKRAIMTTGTTSRTAHLLALTNKGDHVRPGRPGAPPGISHPQGARALLSRLLSRPWPSARITQRA
jgi:hypothetical protein